MRSPAPASSAAFLAALAGIAVTSWGSILVRLAGAPPLAVAFYRMAFATLLILPVAALARTWIMRRPAGRRLANLSRGPPPASTRRVRAMMLVSGACLALHFATWISSLAYTSVGSSVVLVSTTPLFGIALSAFFLGEKASLSSAAAILVAFAGAAVIGAGDYGLGASHLHGDLLALAGAFFAAAYLLIGRGLRDRTAFLPYLTWVYGSSAAMLLLFCGAGRVPMGPFPVATYGWLFLMALGPSVIGHSLLNWAVRHVRAYVVNTASLGEPMLATLYAFIIFGERPGMHLYAGGALVAAGLVGVFAAERRRPTASL